MRIYELFAEKVRIDLRASYQPAMVLLKKDGSRVNYSWFEYKEFALQAMEGLKKRNLKAGELIAVIGLNLPETFFVMLGTILMGAVPVPINVMLLKEAGQKELGKILDDCRPALVLGNACFKKLMPKNGISIEQIIAEGKQALAGRSYGKNVNPAPRQITIPLPERQPQDMLIMPYASGTTGKPKGVMLSEVAIIDRVEAIMKELRTTNRDRVPSYLPLGHIAELVATFFGQIYSGYTIYFTECIEDRIKNPENFLKNFPPFLQQVRATIFLGVPKVWINFQNGIKKTLQKIPVISRAISCLRRFGPGNRWVIKKVKKKLGFPDMRISITAAAPKDQIDMEFLKNLEINLEDIYGQTETGGPILINGKPIGNVRVMISCQKGKEEILVQGKCLMLGYYNNPEATAKVLKDINGNGELVYHTGDTGQWGKRLPDQTFTPILYTGRLDEGGKGGNGEYYSPSKLFELEKEIKKIDGIEEVIFIFEGRPYLTALIFHEKDTAQISVKTFIEIQQWVDRIGEGLYKIKKFKLIGKKGLILTPTMKVKKKEVIIKFQKVIDKMYENSL